ncbi:UNVERIFIED_CONTAM: protein Brevis radix-like 1 [Sesamum calycinum]|uniref:Protein Brevis radix-like 1 n=1 Tax=Sesamum calycinum TaxID=2727403 RepID=A0AAW2M125_9LAMI
MLTCITCSKQRMEDGGEDAPRGTPSTKDAVKSLTTQIKDMALKVSGAHKGKPSQTEESFKKGSSSSTPAWDFTTTGHRAARPDSRFTSFGGDRTPGGLESISAQSGEVVLEDEEEPKEWTAQVEPGVQITFVSLPRGGNDLKRIRFRDSNQQALNTPGRSEDGRDSIYSKLGSARESPRMTPSLNREWTPRYRPPGGKDYFPAESFHGGNQPYGVGSSAYPSGGPKGEMSSMEASRTTTSSRDEASVSISNASDIESEWIEEDEPGVYITIRQLADGTRELRVRFSREKFGEVHAKLWWETNRDRIQAQYLC